MIRIPPLKILSSTILKRVHSGKNAIILVDGKTGSGKTYWAMRMCELLFPRFTVDNIAFSVAEFLDIFPNMKKGDIILLDEGETAYSSRKSMSTENFEMSNVLSTFRYTAVNLCMTLPDLAMLDVNACRIGHFHCRTFDFDRNDPHTPSWMRSRSGVKMKTIVGTAAPGKSSRELQEYFPVLDLPVRNKKTGACYRKTIKVSEVWLSKPSNDLCIEYERRKDRFFQGLLKDAQNNVRLSQIRKQSRMTSAGVFRDNQQITAKNNRNPASLQRYTGSALPEDITGLLD